MIKNRTAIKIFFFLLIAGLLGVIVYYVLRPIDAFKLIFPKINEISNVHVDVRNDEVNAKIYAVVQNENPYPLVIDTFYYQLKLNDIELMERKVPLQLDQDQNEIDTVEIPLQFSIKQVKEVISKLDGKDSTDAETNGYIIYNTIIGQKKLSINKKIRIAVPVPPEIKILKLKLKTFRIGDKTAEVIMKIEIINKGKYIDMQLNGIRYNLKLEDTFSSEGYIDRLIKISPGSSQVLEIPASVIFDRPLRTAVEVVFNKDKVKYDVSLHTNVKINMFKKLNTFPMEVIASGTTELKN